MPSATSTFPSIRATPSHLAVPGVPLLTHHQIAELAEPFARSGHVLDMAASDRLGRRLVFQSPRVAPRADTGGAIEPALWTTLHLQSPRPGHYELTRHARLCRTACPATEGRDDATGLQATLRAEGAEPGQLLERLQAVAARQQFHVGPGYEMASSGCVTDSGRGGGGRHATPRAPFHVTHAVVRTETLTLTLGVSRSGSTAATSAALEIRAHPCGDALPADLPGDLLAVLGWDWSMLQAGPQGWRGSVRLRVTRGARGAGCRAPCGASGSASGSASGGASGGAPGGAPGSASGGASGSTPSSETCAAPSDAPGDDAHAKLHQAAAHLARTLADPPGRFHARLRAARWGALARHSIPVLAATLLAAQVLWADALRAERTSPLTLALLCAPLALLLFYLLRSERPQLALPTWPRPLAPGAWGAAR